LYFTLFDIFLSLRINKGTVLQELSQKFEVQPVIQFSPCGYYKVYVLFHTVIKNYQKKAVHATSQVQEIYRAKFPNIHV